MRLSSLCGFLLALTVSCAPRVTLTSPQTPFRAAFSDEGVAWVTGGQACMARAPQFRPVCPQVGRAVDVAWNGGDAWAAVPEAGLVITLDRAARSVTVGAVEKLSSRAIYRQDGSMLSYDGQPAGEVLGRPEEVLTGGDGLDYVRLEGQVRRVQDGQLVTEEPGFLVRTPTGVSTSVFPAVQGPDGTYRITAAGLELVNSGGQVVVSVPGISGRVGLVGNLVVTVNEAGVVQVFTSRLVPLGS